MNRFQGFYDIWRNGTADSEFRDKFPYKLSLGRGLAQESLPDFLPNPESGAKILVTESYEHMFLRILDFRMKDSGFKKGLVLTGQPGIGSSPRLDMYHPRAIAHRQIYFTGKSTFLGFLLV